MDDSDDEAKCECPALAGWITTFADLMALLMCFFVLLLSFSEMDALKYKQLAGSMAFAFGVQSKVDVKSIPRGTSIIAKEFSPGRPEPTQLNVVRQNTVDFTKSTLDTLCEKKGKAEKSNIKEKGGLTDAEQVEFDRAKALKVFAAENAARVAKELQEQIDKGKVEVETRGLNVIIRVKEQSSFASGSARLRNEFLPIMEKISNILVNTSGKIAIEGHTDDIPIHTPRFRSNWELSASRAVSVAQEIIDHPQIDSKRVTVVGKAHTIPLVPNTDWRNRAKNRRVEIVIEQQGKNKPLKKGLQSTKDESEIQQLQHTIDTYEANEQPANHTLSSEDLF